MYSTLKCQRVLSILEHVYPDQLEPLTRRLYQRLWRDDLDIEGEAWLQEACEESTNLSSQDIQNLLSRLSNQETKDWLTENTEEALKYGMFGAPGIVCFPSEEEARKSHEEAEFEFYWGSDRFYYFMDKFGKIIAYYCILLYIIAYYCMSSTTTTKKEFNGMLQNYWEDQVDCKSGTPKYLNTKTSKYLLMKS